MNIKLLNDYGKEDEKDTYSYKGWLNSDKFGKRAWATFGYSVAGYLSIALLIGLIMMVLYGLSGLLNLFT